MMLASSHQLENARDPEHPNELWLPEGHFQRRFAGMALIAIAAVIAYFPALGGHFIWDDDTLVTKNVLVHASDGLPRMWFTSEPFDYWPMTNSSFWLEWRLWGMNPVGYHVTNLLLHIGAAFLIWSILEMLAIPGAFLAALLFAVHPVNVESVAWIAQRKNTLSILFYLLSILWYLRTDREKNERGEIDEATEKKNGRGEIGGRWYWLSLFAFVVAMLAKGSVAILPLHLLLIAWWRRRIEVRDLIRTAPFFAVAAVLTGVNIWFQTHGSEEVVRTAGIAERLAGAGGAIWFYLLKALIPINLVFIYPNWQIDTGNLLWWLPLLSAILVTFLLWSQRNSRTARWIRPLLFAWLFFCIALVPVLGLTDVYFMKYSLVADHYEYIALIGVAALVGAGWSVWRQRANERGGSAVIGCAVAVVGVFILLSNQQSKMYANIVTLYRTTVDRNPQCWLAYNNLGVALLDSGMPQEAIRCFQQALRAKPVYPDAHSNMGNALSKLGRGSEAIEQYREALREKPTFVIAYYNMGNVFAEAGQSADAIEQYQQALRIKPSYVDAHQNLGSLLLKLGRPQEAIEQLQEAARLNPNLAEAHLNLGTALDQIGWTESAIQQYQWALKIRPDYSEAYNGLGNTFSKSGQDAEAIENYQRALQLSPNYAEAYHNLSLALFKAGRLAEAKSAAKKGLELARAQGQTALAAQIQMWLHSSDIGP